MKNNNNLFLILFYLLFPAALFDYHMPGAQMSLLWIPFFLGTLGNYYFNKKDFSIKEAYSKMLPVIIISLIAFILIKYISVYLIFHSFKLALDIICLYILDMQYYYFIIIFIILNPLLRYIADNEKICKYSLIVMFFFTSFINLFDRVNSLAYVTHFFDRYNDYWFDYHFVYLFMIYYFNSKNISPKTRYIMYSFGVIALLDVIINIEQFKVSNSCFMYVVLCIGLLSKYLFSKIKMKNINIYNPYTIICVILYLSFVKYINDNIILWVLLISVLSYTICYLLGKIKKIRKYIILNYDDMEEA